MVYRDDRVYAGPCAYIHKRNSVGFYKPYSVSIKRIFLFYIKKGISRVEKENTYIMDKVFLCRDYRSYIRRNYKKIYRKSEKNLIEIHPTRKRVGFLSTLNINLKKEGNGNKDRRKIR